jgi:6-phosphogluconolactonase
LVASAEAGTITAFAVREAHGTARLERLHSVEVGSGVSALVLDRSERVLHAALTSARAIVSLGLDAPTGALRVRSRVLVPAGLVYLHLGLGRLFGASYGDDLITSTPLDADELPVKDGTDTLAVGSHPHSIVAEPGAPAVWVAVLGDDVVRRIEVDGDGRFVRDSVAGVLVPAGFGPRHVLVRPGRRELLVVGERTGDVAVIDLDARAVTRHWPTVPADSGLVPGVVREVGEDPRADAEGRPLIWAADLCAHGDTVYTSERRASRVSVSDAARGRLTAVLDTEPQPRGIGLSADGRWLLVSGELSDTVSLYSTGGHRPVLVDRAPVPAGARWVEPLGRRSAGA